MRAVERHGRVGAVHPWMYSTVGNWGTIPTMRRFGQEMAAELRAGGVEGVLLVAT